MQEENLKGEINFGKEKREHPRIEMTVPVRYRILSSEEATKALNRSFDADTILQEYSEGETINVSKTGILMYTNEEVPIKSFIVINMHISIPGISCNCKALAEIMRREKAFDSSKYFYKIALKFHKILHHNLKNYKYMRLNELLDIKEAQV
ncbi:MAG: PilZ domain-containing protein [Candidatus Goldbacteria bacterium]|nr:PilZ domain-containing protein [Candidatus Goldiibacteriota bacterium]